MSWDLALTQVLTSWNLAPAVVLPLVLSGGVYIVGARRVKDRYPAAPWPRHRTASFLVGLGLLYVAVQGPLDVYDSIYLWDHMIQHLVIVMMSAPALLLGAPITLALRASQPDGARRTMVRVLRSRPVAVLSHPIVTWSALAIALVGTHFTSFYELALDHPPIHDLEHLLYLATSLLFWWPVLGVDPIRWRLPHAGRLLYVFLMAPVQAIVGLVVMSAREVLYPHYLHVASGLGPLADQRAAGALMWVTSEVAMVGAVVAVAVDWFRHEERLARRVDARLERGGSPDRHE